MQNFKIKNVLVLLIVAITGVLTLYFYGRSLWYPVYAKIKGRETVSSVVVKYETAVKQRLRKVFERAKLVAEYPENLTFLVFKKERKLEVWTNVENKIIFLKSYSMTAFSGKLGPKLKEGDCQIPEGIYKIIFLNPNSSYHLSMRVNYPNSFDKKMANLEQRTDLGSDIMIHGKDATIGCIPVGDEAIEELFIMAAKAKIHNITLLIFPQDFRTDEKITPNDRQWVNGLYLRLKNKLKEYKH
ncbi:L,D-transpeptidase family protein [Lentisphaerota bacterium WC36G]|nr:L,D-transpeptidase family protein [Lentisphaerae bacterium WC36]